MDYTLICTQAWHLSIFPSSNQFTLLWVQECSYLPVLCENVFYPSAQKIHLCLSCLSLCLCMVLADPTGLVISIGGRLDFLQACASVRLECSFVLPALHRDATSNWSQCDRGMNYGHVYWINSKRAELKVNYNAHNPNRCKTCQCTFPKQEAKNVKKIFLPAMTFRHQNRGDFGYVFAWWAKS